MKVQKALIAEHQFVWLVLGDDYHPIKPILVFIRYLITHLTQRFLKPAIP